MSTIGEDRQFYIAAMLAGLLDGIGAVRDETGTIVGIEPSYKQPFGEADYRHLYYAHAFDFIGNPQYEEDLTLRRIRQCWKALGSRRVCWPSKDILETAEARKEASRPVRVDLASLSYVAVVPVSARKRDGNDCWSIPGCRCCWCGDKIKSDWADFYEVRWSDETITYLEDCCAYEFVHGADNRSGYGAVTGIEE